MPEDQDEKRRPPGRRAAMVRKIAYLYEDEAAAIEREAEDKKCSEAEIIRRSVRRYLDL